MRASKVAIIRGNIIQAEYTDVEYHVTNGCLTIGEVKSEGEIIKIENENVEVWAPHAWDRMVCEDAQA